MKTWSILWAYQESSRNCVIPNYLGCSETLLWEFEGFTEDELVPNRLKPFAMRSKKRGVRVKNDFFPVLASYKSVESDEKGLIHTNRNETTDQNKCNESIPVHIYPFHPVVRKKSRCMAWIGSPTWMNYLSKAL